MGFCTRLREMYPDCAVRAFGLVRSVSFSGIDNILDQQIGTVTVYNGVAHREP
jgi:hypothetical protein